MRCRNNARVISSPASRWRGLPGHNVRQASVRSDSRHAHICFQRGCPRGRSTQGWRTARRVGGEQSDKAVGDLAAQQPGLQPRGVLHQPCCQRIQRRRLPSRGPLSPKVKRNAAHCLERTLSTSHPLASDGTRRAFQARHPREPGSAVPARCGRSGRPAARRGRPRRPARSARGPSSAPWSTAAAPPAPAAAS